MAYLSIPRGGVAKKERYCGYDLPILLLLRRRRKRAIPSDGFDKEQTSVLPELAKKSYSSPELLRPRSLAHVFNVMVTPNFPFIAVRRNIANISRLYNTFERSTCRIEGVIYMTKIYYIRCIFAGMQKRFIASALNGITTPKKIRDRILIPIN
ncbi:hypothetical protein N7530_010757 [Penicillium desertorum]|uniref:Uncharacterized protein n=1 Tax=Penicillium desertorum TaxID=1303715 RepID=A0A9W9WFW4_9EURO|nr:hypothetical protein N7530_010757 [Penicillium desertorum]